MKLLNHYVTQKAEQRRTELHKALLHYQARIGGEVFGPIPKGVRREFFCLDEHTWVWHEEWDDKGGHHAVTTRYDVRPSGVVKSQGVNSYVALSDQEARNLYYAVQVYGQRILPQLQQLKRTA